MLSSLDLVAISDFVLAAVCLFLSGILFGSIRSHTSRYAALCYFLLFAGLSALIGGIDHGFFEAIDRRYVPRTLTYLSIAIATFLLLRYTILSFFKGTVRKVLSIVALVQLVAFIVASFSYHDFILVVGNYAPVLLLFFAMNLIHIRRSKSEFNFTLFCIVSVIATMVQVLDLGISQSVNGDTLFHILAIIAYAIFFIAARSVSDSELQTA